MPPAAGDQRGGEHTRRMGTRVRLPAKHQLQLHRPLAAAGEPQHMRQPQIPR